MSISITRATASPFPSSTDSISTARQAFAQLGQALKSNDVAAAKTAYASVVKNAPSGGASNADGTLAQVGKALRSGDLDGAKAAFRAVLHNGVASQGQQPIRTTDAPILTTPSAQLTEGALDLIA